MARRLPVTACSAAARPTAWWWAPGPEHAPGGAGADSFTIERGNGGDDSINTRQTVTYCCPLQTYDIYRAQERRCDMYGVDELGATRDWNE
jgi:hypothetical protein